ncbi:HAD family phosphatase [Klebsiella pneumoniae]|uniref:HAD family phosphatase n=1 Tax=Klebsiella pneumoniae TaxID=573 RepID=A0A923J7A7_KLEPN|nr:HAD family phosphatase [Klebsiella pneumoniae]
MAENGGWVVSGNEDVFNCQLPVHHFNAVVDHLQTLPNIEIIACGKRSAYTLNRYNDALKTVAAKYYHRTELVDDFNHLDDTILKFGLNVPDSLIRKFSRSCTRRWGHGHRGGHRLRQHRLNYPGCAQSQRAAHFAAALGREDHEVVAFGDSGNDIEMLQHAGFGFAMANARKTSKPSPAIRRRITTKKVSCRLLIRCWIAKRRSPDKTRMRAHPGWQLPLLRIADAFIFQKVNHQPQP